MSIRSMLCWETNAESTKVFAEFTKIVLEAILHAPDSSAASRQQWLDCVSPLRELPPNAVLRIVTAPETYTQTVQASKGDSAPFTDFLHHVIAAEFARLGHAIHSDVGVWSALGDYYLPTNDAMDTTSADGQYAWTEDHVYRSPQLMSSLVVDFFSPYARRDLPVAKFRPVQFGAYTPYAEAEARDIVGKLESAMLKLAQISPIALAFVLRFARTIIPRKETLNPSFYTSSSCNAYIGRIVLINPHLDYVEDTVLIDSLIHESIHSLLWRAELLNPFIVDPSKVRGTTRSPWTGSELHLYTFLQACFVWFGLLTFWNLPQATYVFPRELVAKYTDRARRGFEGGQLIANVVQFKEALRSGLFPELETMQAQANATP